ncbi:MAG: cytochrome c [Chitinophagaceae bacterium]|jgi:cytochrome c551/c552|nr:cytochrome c [Chitinophagaceae bacterium]
MKKLFVIAITGAVLAIAACGNENNAGSASDAKKSGNGNPSYDSARGVGKFTKVDVGEKLDAKLADEGNKIYNVKCMSCHKLTSEKLVGPGWKGVTQRKKAEWIMNFATNTDEMLNKDPEAQAQLELCLVRMPNQNISDDEARQVYEFMRKNDGVQ